jgi:primosomal replication protein N
MKRNLSCAIRTNCCYGDKVVLKTAVESVLLEHHFNNHSLCDNWCKVKSLQGTKLVEAMLKYRSKEINNQFYLQVKTLFEEFYLLLNEMLQEWDTNIVEGLTNFFMKFLPKDKTYAMTIENKVQI